MKNNEQIKRHDFQSLAGRDEHKGKHLLSCFARTPQLLVPNCSACNCQSPRMCMSMNADAYKWIGIFCRFFMSSKNAGSPAFWRPEVVSATLSQPWILQGWWTTSRAKLGIWGWVEQLLHWLNKAWRRPSMMCGWHVGCSYSNRCIGVSMCLFFLAHMMLSSTWRDAALARTLGYFLGFQWLWPLVSSLCPAAKRPRQSS